MDRVRIFECASCLRAYPSDKNIVVVERMGFEPTYSIHHSVHVPKSFDYYCRECADTLIHIMEVCEENANAKRGRTEAKVVA